MAIKLLEISNKQKKAFMSYKMREQLKNFYVEQRNIKKLFLLRFKAKELTETFKALNYAIYFYFNNFSI